MVHFASDEAGVPADHAASPRRQLHGLALRSSFTGRASSAGSASPSCLEGSEAGQQPSQKNMNSHDGSLAASVEAGMFAEQSESIEREPVQLLASAAAGPASTAVSSPHGEAWASGRTTVPRRLPPLTLSRQGTAGPTTLLSGDWVSCHAEKDFDCASRVLLSRSSVCMKALQHLALPVTNMAKHSSPTQPSRESCPLCAGFGLSPQLPASGALSSVP